MYSMPPVPEVGSQRKVSENMRISMMPIQKVGKLCPNRESVIAA